MSAPNFHTMDCIDLYVMGDYDICRYYIGEEDEDGNEIKEYSMSDIDCAWDLFTQDLKDGIQYAIDNLNSKLKWFKVELKDGYYSGVQIYADTDWCDFYERSYFVKENYIWDDEACEEEFGLSREKTKEMIEAEIETINQWLENEATDYGFRKLVCDCVFSNGEAIYHYA